MTIYGWLVMLLSVGSVVVLFIWCIYKVLTVPGETEHIHGFESEPPDVRHRSAQSQSQSQSSS